MDKLGRAAAVCALLMAVLSAQAGHDEGMNALATRDFPRARAEFETEPDNPKALYQLSRMARFGQGEAPDEARAARLLSRAASLGHLEARLDLVFVLGNGRGVPKDPAAAIQLLETLAAEGQAEAEVNLGRVFRFGWWDQARDDARATRHFEKAMRGGDDNGRALYAQALIEGLGVARDEARGAQLLQEAAERGHIESQLEYGRILTAGLGVAKDIREWRVHIEPEISGETVIMLATDGVADDLLPEKRSSFINFLVAQYGGLPATERSRALAKSLREWPTPRHLDDKTVAVLWNAATAEIS